MNIADEIQKLQSLRDSGSLSESEFNQAKNTILNNTQPAKGLSFIHKMGRSRTDSMLGGVCGGLAQQTSTPAWLWRLVFAGGAFVSFGAIALLYILMWFLMPYSDA